VLDYHVEFQVDKMFDAGLFERNLGKGEVEHKLSDEAEAMIQQAIKYGSSKPNSKYSSWLNLSYVLNLL